MARQSNADYWAQRMKQMEEALLDHSYTYVENLDKRFDAAIADVEKSIAMWYQRFAVNNEISLADAKKWLTANELKEFHWSVEEYIKFGEENAITGAWMKQLENASAKVHISRLEALKLEIQQQAEALHAEVEAATEKAAREIYEASYYHTGYEVQKGLGFGWSMAAINDTIINKVLSRPWTADMRTFRDRCWKNKTDLVDGVTKHLTQMIIRGEAPDRAIAAIAKDFNVSKSKAGRLVMTESAYFSSAAQKDCFDELDVEEYQVIASIDVDTCSLCGAMDGKVFKMSDYQEGLTANPFHPYCRCCTAPYFADQQNLINRYAEDVVTGKAIKLEPGATYEDWRKMQDELHGAGTVEKYRIISYNEKADKRQWQNYVDRLGNDAPANFKAFQEIKYNDPAAYADLEDFYRYKGKNPDSSKGFFNAEKERRDLLASGAVRAKGTVVKPPSGFAIDAENEHAKSRLAERNITVDEAQGYIDNAVFALKQQKGKVFAFYSKDGFAAIDTDGLLRTAGHLDEKGKLLFDKVVTCIENSK